MFNSLPVAGLLIALSLLYSQTAEAQFEAWGSETSEADVATSDAIPYQPSSVSTVDRARSLRVAGIILSTLGPVTFNAAFTAMPYDFSAASMLGLMSGGTMLVVGTIIGIVGHVMRRRIQRSSARGGSARLMIAGGWSPLTGASAM